MTGAAWAMFGVAGACMAVDWWAVFNDRARAEQLAKPAVMLALIASAVAIASEPTSLRVLIVAALLCGLIGDVALLPRFDSFIAGLASFLIGHLLYVAAFATIWSPSLWLLLGVAGLAMLFRTFAVPIAQSLTGSPLRIPVTMYIGVTGAVIISGTGTARWLMAFGTLAFAASDGLLGADRFVEPAPRRRWVVHALYHAGQTAIVVGMLTV